MLYYDRKQVLNCARQEVRLTFLGWLMQGEAEEDAELTQQTVAVDNDNENVSGME